jgi:pilus assembly protein CpaB
MSVARLLVLVAAGVAAVLVWLYVRNSSATVAPAPQAVAAVSSGVRVLVASRDLELGTRVTPADLAWRAWPDAGVSPLFVTDRDDTQAIEHHAGAIVRDRLAEGEPVTSRKLVTAGSAGFMAAILEPGRRAVATEIDAETAAGGFILPGDRVDVIVTFQSEGGGPDGGRTRMSRTILENVRVLAIDQSPSRAEEDQVKVGSTATLELTPGQSELLALAQAMGVITLSLRSIADISPEDQLLEEARASRGPFGAMGETLTIYRYGARSDTMLGGSQ